MTRPTRTLARNLGVFGASFVMAGGCSSGSGSFHDGGSAIDSMGGRAGDSAGSGAGEAIVDGGIGNLTGQDASTMGMDAEASIDSGGGTFCSGTGPIVTIPGTTSTITTCTGRIAESKFLNALCTCNNTSVAGYLRVRGFDSKKGPPSNTNQGGGSVGVNFDYISSVNTDVQGFLTVIGPNSSFSGSLQVGGDFSVANNMTLSGVVNVHRNLWYGGSLWGVASIMVDGDLYGDGTVIAFPLEVGGARHSQHVTVAKPCPCDPSDFLDVGALVDDAKVKNDNVAAQIDPKMFNLVLGDAQATLSCGRYYIERMGGAGSITINVTGRVALFIDQAIEQLGKLEFRLSPTAEIDIFVRGDVALTGTSSFGSKDRPAATRLYVGSTGNLLMTGDFDFVGNVYAPRSRVSAAGNVRIFGSMFAENFNIPGYASFTYDTAIQHAGDSCPNPQPPPGTCKHCGTCTGGTACVDGSCGACRSDSDCCSPLTCSNGVCSEPTYVIY